jgi:hypothetical protein
VFYYTQVKIINQARIFAANTGQNTVRFLYIGLLGDKAEPFRHPEYMGIDRHHRLGKAEEEHARGRLGAYALKGR